MNKGERLRKHFKLVVWISRLTIAVLAMVTALPTSADGNNELFQSARHYLRGDVVSAGVGLRGTGAGEITLSGIPVGAEVYQAYLYWGTLGSVNTYNSPTLDGVEIDNGELIGTSGDTCWNVQHNYVYRADVTSLVNGNGTYTIEGLPDSLLSGNDSQGASLVVVYSDESEPYRTVVINDGAVTLDIDNNVYTNTLTSYRSDNPVSDAHITYLIGDGQSRWDTGNVTFTNTSIAEDVFNGVDGEYWGTLNFDVTALTEDSPVNTAINNNDPDNPDSPDCLLWAATIFSVTSPPPSVGINELSPFYNTPVYGDVTASGIGLRGKGEGDITVSGIPAGTEVYRAFLYWATLGSNDEYTSPTFNGTPVDGTLIGTSADTCWNVENNYVYRAEVSDLVDGNGSYHIAGLPDALIFEGNDSQGASLVIVYSGPLDEQKRRKVIINDGAVTLDLDVHAYTDTISGYISDDPTTEARVVYLVGDGQSQWRNGNVQFNEVSIAKNVFNGVDGEHWGTLAFDVTELVDESPSVTSINNYNPQDGDSPDCLLWAATVFTVTTPETDFGNKTYLPMIHR